MSAIMEFLRGQDPVMLALLGMGLFLIVPVIFKQVASVMGGFFKKKPDPTTPADGPSIEVIAKEWADLYKICHGAKLYDACEKLDEAWMLLRKKEREENGGK